MNNNCISTLALLLALVASNYCAQAKLRGQRSHPRKLERKLQGMGMGGNGDGIGVDCLGSTKTGGLGALENFGIDPSGLVEGVDYWGPCSQEDRGSPCQNLADAIADFPALKTADNECLSNADCISSTGCGSPNDTPRPLCRVYSNGNVGMKCDCSRDGPFLQITPLCDPIIRSSSASLETKTHDGPP